MPLNVHMPSGTFITLDVDPTDPVLWVKEQIEGFMGLPFVRDSEQQLIYEGKPLEDRIPPDGTIHLSPTGKAVTVQMQNSDTVDNANKLQGFWSKTPYLNRYREKTDDTVDNAKKNTVDTLSVVKAKLAPLAQLPVEELNVVSNGSQTLGEYDVPADAALEVIESFGMTVRTPDGATVVLQTDRNEPLMSCRPMVAIPVNLQQLYHAIDSNGPSPCSRTTFPRGPPQKTYHRKTIQLPML
jgi:hypothetical protein